MKINNLLLLSLPATPANSFISNAGLSKSAQLKQTGSVLPATSDQSPSTMRSPGLMNTNIESSRLTNQNSAEGKVYRNFALLAKASNDDIPPREAEPLEAVDANDSTKSAMGALSSKAGIDKSDTPEIIEGIKYHPPRPMSGPELVVREITKNVLYHLIYIKNAIDTLRGLHKPIIEFKVAATPPSIFINFAIKPDMLDAFHKYLKLPESVKLLPISVAAGEEPRYAVTANAYKAMYLDGFEEYRVDWTSYIDSAVNSTTPAYLMIKTDSSRHSMDPDRIISKPAKELSYIKEDGTWHLTVKSNEGDLTLHYPDSPKTAENQVMPNATWVAANDRCIYPDTMLNDLVTCMGSAFAQNMKTINVTIDQDTPPMNFLHFVDPEPYSAYALQSEAVFMVQPWHNIDEARLSMRGVQNYLDELITVIRNAFSGKSALARLKESEEEQPRDTKRT